MKSLLNKMLDNPEYAEAAKRSLENVFHDFKEKEQKLEKELRNKSIEKEPKNLIFDCLEK